MKNARVPVPTLAGLFLFVLAAACDPGPAPLATEADVDQAEQGAASLSAAGSNHFIVTRIDVRRCAYPICGGYFVRQVNRLLTRCADGQLRRECHAVDLDFAPSGLSPEQAAAFERELFAQKHGLVLAQLVQRPTGTALPADTLVINEAWAGQARSTATGVFGRLASTGIVCVTFPCPSFRIDYLNSTMSNPLNAIDLAASGAPADALERARAALARGQLLAAGRPVPIRGPAGVGFDFVTSELYLQVQPAAPICAAQDATGVGPCDRFFGYRWDGRACVGVSGCSCVGAGCADLPIDLADCEKAHAGCKRFCGVRGAPPCAATEWCDFPDGSLCGAADQPGVCQPRPDLCITLFRPVCGCDGVTYSNACVANASGVDVSTPGVCAP